MTITFGLLGLAICAVWFSPAPGAANYKSPWLWLLAAASGSALIAGYLSAAGVAGLGLLAVLAYFARRAWRRWQVILYSAATAFLALALALHWMPGFNNPVLVANIRFSADAAPFSQFANLDKAAAGLVLLALLCKRAANATEWGALLRRSARIAAGTAVAAMIAAMAFGQVRFDPKLPAYTPVFLATNLLFTCVSEEAFFRGFLQERIARGLERVPHGRILSVAGSGLLFGAAHAAGGLTYVMLATLAGLGYAYAYATTQRVEAPIIVHFVVNAVHFLGFTYPRLA